LKLHLENAESELATEIANKLFREGTRDPDIPHAPKLPSERQQELHNVTHQPFAPWCEACVLGRSRQSPHDKASEEE
jgi:hypothetical protein